MSIQQGYNQWAAQYDTNENKTRDAEAIVLKHLLKNVQFNNCLEIGCGTGKNTEWLQTKATFLLGIDFSEAMLQQAEKKMLLSHVQLLQANILEPWAFVQQSFDVVIFSLVLEHIEHLTSIFTKAAAALHKGGYMYVGELHPFKQYAGSKARYLDENGWQVLTCYIHHVSDFINAGIDAGFEVNQVYEYFDEGDTPSIPRIIGILFQLQ